MIGTRVEQSKWSTVIFGLTKKSLVSKEFINDNKNRVMFLFAVIQSTDQEIYL